MPNRFILIITALTFFVCGNIQAQNAYKFSEPKDSVAKIIWNILKTQDDCISRVTAELEKIDKNKCAEAEHFKSKTAMDFDFHFPYSDNPNWDSVSVKYQLQCYQKSNGSWIAVINQVVFNVYLDFFIEACEGLMVVQYTGKKISYQKCSSVFPKDFDFYKLDNIYSKVIFSDTEMHYYNRHLGPLHLVWNGKSFDSSSKVLYHCITGGCAFDYTLEHPTVLKVDKSLEYLPPSYYLTIGSKWKGSPDGIIYDGKKTIAKFDLKDGIIESYTILHPSYGTALEFTEDNYVASAPVTMGTPMQYVLNHLGEIPTTKTFANGKFVVTLHRVHDTKYARRDIFLEFTSKNENSPIESIRVYSTPLTVTLMSEVERENLTNEAKTIFKALNFNEKENGEFKRIFINFNEKNEAVNGFDMEFATDGYKQSDDWIAFDYDLTVKYQIYKAENKYLVVLSKIKDISENLGDKFWYYENGQLIPAEISLPEPDIEDCRYKFTEQGLLYYNDNDEQQVFVWNGNEFVKQ